jgi:hypothetical protein
VYPVIGQDGLGLVDRQARDLDLKAVVVLSLRLDHEEVAAARVGDEQQGQLEAAEG